jgi:hypothetical protein
MSQTKKIHRDEIVIDERCQARANVHPDVVDEYAEAYRAGAELPPIEVFLVDGKPWCVDGMHRYAAQVKADVAWVRTVIVGNGSAEDAIAAALMSNRSHGVRRSNADKHRAVRLALDNPRWADASSRQIADDLGVSHPFVSAIRAEWEAERRPLLPEPTATQATGDVVTVSTSPEKRRDSVGRMQPAAKPSVPKERVVLDELELSPDEDVETETRPGVVLPCFGPVLVEAAKEIARARAAVSKIDLPHSFAQSVASSLKSVEANLRYGVPEVCPRCEGAKCMHCRERGWVEKSEGDQLRASVKAMAR